MKIGVDIRELRSGSSTGIGRYLRAFLDYAERRPAGRSFVLYGDASTGFDGFAAAARRVLTAPWPWSDHRELPRLLARDAVDVFFSPYYKAPWNCPCPAVVTIHDVMCARVGRGGAFGPLRDRFETALTGAFAARAAGVLTVSEFSKKDIERVLGIPPEKITVVPNGVPPGFSPVEPARRADLLAKMGVPAGVVLFVGSFKPSKNAGALVEAYAGLPADVRARHPLALVGPRDAAYHRFRRRWGGAADGARARFLSGVGDEGLAALYSSCALCVVPSLYEGFGMPALEALACGAPVLAADRTSLPEVVGDAGELCAPEAASLREALARLLGDPGRLRDLAARGPARAAKFSPDACGAAILAALERRAGGRPS